MCELLSERWMDIKPVLNLSDPELQGCNHFNISHIIYSIIKLVFKCSNCQKQYLKIGKG